MTRRTWAHLCAAGLVGLSAPLATTVILGSVPQAVAQIPGETPEQRCQRETEQYNQTQQSLWAATHPGQQIPTPPPWPPYVCVGGPQVTPPTTTGGGSGAAGDGRPHRWDGQSIAGNRQPGWSDTGVDIGSPRTGIARTPADPAAPSALESARSNITAPVVQVAIDDADNPREVIAAEVGPRRVVVDTQGRTTGHVVTIAADGQPRLVDDASVPVGVDADELSPTTPDPDAAAPGGANPRDTGAGDGQADIVAAQLAREGYEAAAIAGGAVAAVVGAIAAAAAGGGRRVPRLPRITPAGAAGGGVPPVPWAGKSAQFGWIQPDGDLQRFVVMADGTSARAHRFAMDVPHGGQMVKNPDGSIDVVDGQGRVVDHVKTPWAYDAAGQPVDTWYEVDNESGELVQHVAPDESTVFPIIADPEQSKKTANKKSTSNLIDPKTRASMDRAQASKRAAESRKTKAKPAPTPTEQKRREANNRHTEYANGGNPPPQRNAPQPPATTAPRQNAPRTSSPDDQLFLGDKSPYATGASQREVNGPSNSRRGDLDSMSPEGDHIGRGRDGRVAVHGAGEGAVTSNPDGSQTVTDGGRTTTYYPTTRGDVTDKMQIESHTYDADRNETRQVFIKPDGSRVEQRRPGKQQVNSPVSSRRPSVAVASPEQHVADVAYTPPASGTGQGTANVYHPSTTPGAGTVDVVPADGPPVTVDASDGAVKHLGTTDHPAQGPVAPGYYHPRTGTIESNRPPTTSSPDAAAPVFGRSDIATGIFSIGNDTAFEAAEKSAASLGSAGDDLAKAARIGGRSTGALGGIIGAEIDRQSGMDTTEAYVTNGLGVLAAGATGFAIATAPVSIPVAAGAALVLVAGVAATKGSQWIWKKATN